MKTQESSDYNVGIGKKTERTSSLGKGKSEWMKSFPAKDQCSFNFITLKRRNLEKFCFKILCMCSFFDETIAKHNEKVVSVQA